MVNRDGSGLVRLTIPGNPLVTVSSNHADRNDDLGIEATEQVTDGGGNTAMRNGDKRQCVNVPCN